jgi:hypothetical protein
VVRPQAVAAGEVILAWIDPGSASEHPSWPLRNVLLAAAAVLRLRRLRVLCARLRGNSVSTSASLVLDVALPDVPPGVFTFLSLSVVRPAMPLVRHSEVCQSHFSNSSGTPNRIQYHFRGGKYNI